MGRNKAICFDVYVNGKRACLAGIDGFGVLSTILSWVARSPSRRPRGVPKKEWSKRAVTLDVGGMVTRGKASERVAWLVRELAVGDEIRILVTKNGKHDPPRTTTRVEPDAKGRPPPRTRRGGGSRRGAAKPIAPRPPAR